MVDVSIIVPAYNVADYIDECLNALSQQTFDGHYEVIIIDDASTDKSLHLAQAYAQKDDRFTVIAKSVNGGVSNARNAGLSVAEGRYIAFVDPDDTLPNDAIQHLYNAAIRHNADIVKGNNTTFNEHKAKPANYNVKSEKVITGNAILTALLSHKTVRGHPWGKLFKRGVIRNTLFPDDICMCEDLLFCVEVFSRARKIVFIPNTVYSYRLRNSGATGNKYLSGAYLDWLNAIEKCGSFVSTPQQNKEYKKLQIRTLLQMVREVRNLSMEKSHPSLQALFNRQKKWKLTYFDILINKRLGLPALIHYTKFRKQLSALK